MSAMDTIDRERRRNAGYVRRFLAVVGAFDLKVERYRTRRALLDMSDHQLRDIGVTRPEALREASRPFWE